MTTVYDPQLDVFMPFNFYMQYELYKRRNQLWYSSDKDIENFMKMNEWIYCFQSKRWDYDANKQPVNMDTGEILNNSVAENFHFEDLPNCDDYYDHYFSRFKKIIDTYFSGLTWNDFSNFTEDELIGWALPSDKAVMKSFLRQPHVAKRLHQVTAMERAGQMSSAILFKK